MKITMNHENITCIATDMYVYEGSIHSQDALIIELPKGASLTVNGSVRASGSIVVKNGSLYAEENIGCSGSIICAKELCSYNGNISAVTGIKVGKLISVEFDVSCIEGDIVAPTMRCSSFDCKNAKEMEKHTQIISQPSNEEMDSFFAKIVAEAMPEMLAALGI